MDNLLMPLDPFHLGFVIAPGLLCVIFLVGREFTGDQRPDATFIALSIVCGLTTISGTVLGVTFLAPLMQMMWFTLTGDPRPWPAFISLRPPFFGVGWLIGTWGALMAAMLLTGISIQKNPDAT